MKKALNLLSLAQFSSELKEPLLKEEDLKISTLISDLREEVSLDYEH